MPTGYTADVANGKVTDLRTFALQCARNFGATIVQRDDPASDPPKHREPTDYYTKELKREREELHTLTQITSYGEAELGAHQAYEADLANRIRYRNEKAATRDRYEAMIEEVRAWEPPSSHVELKRFMLKQLRESIEFDCGGDFWQDNPSRLTGEAWRAKRIEELTQSIQRHEKHEAEELVRCAEANEWIDALYAALETTGVSA